MENQARHSQLYAPDDAAVPKDAFTEGNSMYAKIQRFAGRFKIEQRGIERVPEDERTDTNLANVGTMVSLSGDLSSQKLGADKLGAAQWLSANMVVSSFAIGALAVTVFHLGFVDGLLTTLFFNLLAITPVAFYSTFGPRYGLRQMILSRYYFGFHGVKIGELPLRTSHWLRETFDIEAG